MVRMRFQGGTVMEFWLATIGRMYFVKGYYPPMAKLAQNSPEQALIRRVFRVVPMSSLNEFCDQLRRELQSLVLLRVAAALTRSDQALARRGWRVGQCHVHQSQMCVVGELWQDARQRQIIGIAKWDASSHSNTALAGLGDDEWNLTLYFGPKHPTSFDIPRNMKGPWVTCFPPTQPATPLLVCLDELYSELGSSSSDGVGLAISSGDDATSDDESAEYESEDDATSDDESAEYESEDDATSDDESAEYESEDDATSDEDATSDDESAEYESEDESTSDDESAEYESEDDATSDEDATSDDESAEYESEDDATSDENTDSSSELDALSTADESVVSKIDSTGGGAVKSLVAPCSSSDVLKYTSDSCFVTESTSDATAES
ncbi:hypothetical protein GGF48_004930, partial [Coemansia sp. RSA 921]